MYTDILKRYIINAINGLGIYWYGRKSNNCVALTFDDGPNEKYTPMVLDILKSAHLNATFFLVGEKIRSNISLVKRMIREGHEIGNHTYTHREMPELTWEDIKFEITKTDKLLSECFNLKANYLRLPKGNWRNYLIILIALLLEKKLVFWSVDPHDYKAESSTEIISNIREIGVKADDIILLHDKQHHTVKALSQIVQDLKDKGLKAVTLSVLLAR